MRTIVAGALALALIGTTSTAAGKSGEEVYGSTCATCHATGVAGAPRYGNQADWAPRVKLGKEALHASALKGKGAMPPKGGNDKLSPSDVRNAVDYMLKAVR
jgi:cytochrome c5